MGPDQSLSGDLAVPNAGLHLGHVVRTAWLARVIDVIHGLARQRRRRRCCGRRGRRLLLLRRDLLVSAHARHRLSHLAGHDGAHPHLHHIAHDGAALILCGGKHCIGGLGLLVLVEVDVLDEAGCFDSLGDTAGHRLGDLVGQRDVHCHLGDLETELVVDALLYELGKFARQRDLLPLEVDRTETGLEDHVRERHRDDSAEQLCDLVGLDSGVGTDDFLQKGLNIGDFDDAETVGADLHHLEIGVANRDGLRSTPA